MITISELHSWIKHRSRRDQWFLFLLGLVFIYFIHSMFVLRPLLEHKKILNEKIVSLEAQKVTLQEQSSRIQQAIKNPAFLEQLDEQKRIKNQIDFLQKKLYTLSPILLKKKDFPKLTKDLLMNQSNRMILIRFRQFPVVIFPSDTLKNKIELLNILGGEVYQRSLEMEFQNDYFGTVNYVKRLEELPWNIYWDSFDYKVVDYPTARAVIVFHVLSIQKSG